MPTMTLYRLSLWNAQHCPVLTPLTKLFESNRIAVALPRSPKFTFETVFGADDLSSPSNIYPSEIQPIPQMYHNAIMHEYLSKDQAIIKYEQTKTTLT